MSLKDRVDVRLICDASLVSGFLAILGASYLWADELQAHNGWGSLIIYAAPLLLPLALLRRRLAKPSEERVRPDGEEAQRNPSLLSTILVSLPAIGLMIFIVAHRYTTFPYPQGTDTPFYAYGSGLMVRGRLDLVIGSSRELTYLVIVAFRAIGEDFLGFTEFTSFVVMPFLFASFLVFSFVFLSFSVSKDLSLTVISSLVLVTSGFFIRFTWDLFSAMLSFALLNIFIAMYFRTRESTSTTRRVATLSVLDVLVALGGTFTYLVGSVVFSALWIEQRWISKKRDLNPIGFFVILILPGLYVVASIFLTKLISIPPTWYERTVTPTASEGLLYAIKLDTHPFSLPGTWGEVVLWEDPFYIWFGAASLIFVLFVSEAKSGEAILPWSISFSLLFLVTGYPDWYRLVPIMLSLAIGTALTAVAATSVGWLRRFRRLGLSRSPRSDKISKIVVISLVGAAILPLSMYYATTHSFAIPDPSSFPDGAAVEDLVAIRDYTGWGNVTAVVLVNAEPSQSNFAWARAVVGTDVYIGNLTSFRQKVPFSAAGVGNIVIDPCRKAYALLPSHLYSGYGTVNADVTMPNFKIMFLPTC